MISHELRTPLNAVIGFSDMIKGEPGADDINKGAGPDRRRGSAAGAKADGKGEPGERHGERSPMCLALVEAQCAGDHSAKGFKTIRQHSIFVN